MRKWIFLITGLLLWSCEDVIEVDAPTEPPRLIVDALFRVDLNEPYVPVEVKLTSSGNFFGDIQITRADRVIIFIEKFDENGNVIESGSSTLAEKESGTGIYIPDPNFSEDQRIATSLLTDDVRFTLFIEHIGRQYAAQTRFVPSVPIDSLEQGTETLFDDDETEIIITYTDDPDRTNFYVFDFGFDEYFASEDTFYEGQQFSFSYFYDQKFNPGRELEISILGADQEFYNYMNLLVEQADDDFNVFDTPVATVRGNVFEVTGLDNIDIFDNVERPDGFALGYFAIVEEYKETLTIQ